MNDAVNGYNPQDNDVVTVKSKGAVYCSLLILIGLLSQFLLIRMSFCAESRTNMPLTYPNGFCNVAVVGTIVD
jgi:hypothetical protein